MKRTRRIGLPFAAAAVCMTTMLTGCLGKVGIMPTPLPTASPPSPSIGSVGSSNATIQFYHPAYSGSGSSATVSWPQNPGVGPIKAIPAEIEANNQSFVYATDRAMASGTFTFVPYATGSSPFCSSETYSFTAFAANGTQTPNPTSLSFPSDALGVVIKDPNAASDIGACYYLFSDGPNSVTVPFMINPIQVFPPSAFNGTLFEDSVSKGGAFALALNPAAYTAAGLLTPSSLTLDTTDRQLVNPFAGIANNGAPGVPACASQLGVALTLTQTGKDMYYLTFPSSSQSSAVGSVCEVYLEDGVTGEPIDIVFDLGS
jgi:hypothetical protein